MSAEEKKNRRIGIVTSLAVHGVLFAIFFFMMAWRAPDPPLPEFGIELNFGLDTQGSGDVQPETPVGQEDGQAEEDTQSKPEEVKTEEVKPEVKEEVKELPAVKTNPEQVTSKEEGDVSVKEEKKEVKKETKKNDKVEAKPEEKLKAEFKKEDKKEVADKDASKKGVPGSQGDDDGKTGDKGSPEGKLDAKALYGTPGGGGGGDGLNLQMSGWSWAEQPKVPELPDNDNGRVVFEIECDENGDIVAINTLERSLSPKSEQLLKAEIRKNSLIKTSGGQAPERSKGRIVFVLKTR